MPHPNDLERRFFKLAILNILANVTVPLAGLVDTAMLGHLADIRFLAGVALASVIFDYVYWTFGFLRMSTTGTTAQALGRGDRDEVHRTLFRSLAFALGLGVVVLVFRGPLEEAGFALLSGEPGVEAAGRDYFDARIWGAPAALCSFVLLGWFLGRGESRYVLLMTVVANLSNVFFNYVFIIRLQLAARGAGLATMVSQYVMVAVAAGLFYLDRTETSWRWKEVFDRQKLIALVRLNTDILVRTLCLVSAFAVFTNFSSQLGVLLLAANSVLMRLFSLAAYVIDGAAFASESLAGILLGRGDRAGLRRLFRLSLLSGAGFIVVFLIGLAAAREPVLAVLTSHGDLIEQTLIYMPWLVPVLFFGALAFMYDGLFLGLTEGRLLRNAMLLSLLVGFLPVAWIAAHEGNNHVLWASMALFMIARTATLWIAARKRLAA